MMHTGDSLAAELLRLRQCRPVPQHRHVPQRPGADAAPPVLSLFVIDVSGDTAAYVERLRSVLAPAVRLGCTADFEQESLPVDEIPGWFAEVCSGPGSGGGGEERAPRFARAGREAYADHTGGGGPWDLQDWLYRFDQDEDSRGWEWWDATVAGPSRVHVRVDSWGESFFGCQDLLWAVFTAGAVRVEGPMVQITSSREKP
ncbi:hypothetical protein F2B00_29710 [Streptomyces parvus]|uniref:hypothetical protein n=1 Tax=Streptomyces parvus TaxID=66428 RepID=UPI00123C2ADE|nr:hypothetical protein [Streptomyces parvus]KAA6198685.1 hypothetical protein F2B00_29710 [Streptomyces parvus]GGS26691.1 hypothetical protein GCM10010221_24960 [Streptomyces parvus]